MLHKCLAIILELCDQDKVNGIGKARNGSRLGLIQVHPYPQGPRWINLKHRGNVIWADGIAVEFTRQRTDDEFCYCAFGVGILQRPEIRSSLQYGIIGVTQYETIDPRSTPLKKLEFK